MRAWLGSGELLGHAQFDTPEETVDFIGNVLEASTEYSMIAMEADGAIVLWNQGARLLYGYEPEEVLGRSATMLHVDQDAARGLPLEMMRAALETGKWEGTVDRRRRDASTFPARVVVTPLRGCHGMDDGFLLISKDISDEVRLAQELQETQAYTRSLIESNIDALMTTDPLGVITDVNQQMEELTGRGRDELIGSRFKGCFTDPALAEDGIRLVLQEGRVTNYELTARAKDGTETVVSYNASTFNDAGGKLRGVFAAARDVTAHKTLERLLRDSEAYNRGLIEASVDGLVTVSPAGQIMDVNEQMCRLSRYSREDLIGTPFAEYFADDSRATDGVNKTFEKGVVTDYVLTLRPYEGDDVQVSFNASVFRDPAGEVRGIFASARDITDQAHLQRQLSDERAYNRGLIEASVDGLITVDALMRITDVNETMCRMTGYKRTELVGSSFPDYFTDPAEATRGVRQTLDRGAVTDYELTLRNEDGAERLVSFNAAIFRDQDNDVRGIFASARDITEQAALQSMLADEQVYNRSLIEASADAQFAIAPDGVITDVNEEATRLTGYSRKHLVSSQFVDYFTDPGLAGAGVREALHEGRVLGYELVLVTRHGRRMTVSFNAAVFSDAAGKRQGILAGARDSTAQKALEQELIDKQSYTRSLIESSIDALMTTDLLGVITDVNEQMEQLTGRSREELVGSPFKAYFTEPDRAEDGIRLVLREGTVTNYELTARAKDGTQTVVSYNASTFHDAAGKLQGVFAAARDVTENKELEAKLHRTNVELEDANVTKDRFLASMSHELRTPLNAILGFTGTMLMGIAGPLTDDQEDQLHTVEQNGKHLLSIINDLLDLAKIESGKVDLKFEAFTAQEVVEEVTSGLRSLADDKDLALKTVMPEEALRIRSDRRALCQILINLANNAIKFTDSGEVTIVVEQVRDDHRVLTRFTVLDTGRGIKPADQGKLFAAFEQVGVSATRRHEGTGLGLYISRKLAEKIHGTISFHSEEDKGSEFVLEVAE